MKKIDKIIIERLYDDSPMLDYLGKFSDEKGKFAIEHNGGNNSYKYFNADNVENMKQAKENYNRIMKYETGELCDYGVKATAIIKTFENETYWLMNEISSGGLWGLSSDSDNSYFLEEEQNQLEELKEVLKEFGFSKKEINQAKIERKEN